MCDPVPEDPQDAVVAKEFTENRELYNKNAREWTQKYATKEYVK